MGHFKRGKIRRDRKMGMGRFGSEDRHRYSRVVADGELVRETDYVEAWDSGEFDNRLGTTFQGMDVPYKLNRYWEWQTSERRRRLNKRYGGMRKYLNARAVRPRYKNVDRETIRYRGDGRADGLEIEELFGVGAEERASEEAFDRYLNYDPTPTTGVCKACDAVMTYKEARLSDSDICWDCSMSIDKELMSMYLEEGEEFSDGLDHLVRVHGWLDRG